KAEQPSEVVPVPVAEREGVDGPRIEAEHAEIVGDRGLGGAEVEGDPRRLGAPRDLDEVGEAVLGPQVHHLTGHEGAVPAGDLLILAERVDVVVHHRGDANAVDRGERSHQSTRVSSRYITLWRVVLTQSSIS